MFKSALGALALAGGAKKGITQTSPFDPRLPRAPQRCPAGINLLSTAVLDSYGLAAGNVWSASNTGTLKSDDLVRASALLRVTTAHLDEIGVNAYIATQISQPPPFIMSPASLLAAGDQFRSHGILLTDAEIQQHYSSLDPNTQQQALLSINQMGVSGAYNQLASAFDLAANKLRLQEIATACGEMLDLLPSSRSSLRATPADALSPRLSGCQALALTLTGLGFIFGYTIETPYGWVLGMTWLFGSGIYTFSCTN
jgi:hypothetical protein